VMSVDEMACRLMGRERAVANATKLAVDIKEAIRSVGETLRCSVGLAPNRYLAKLASDMLKPDGMTVLLQRDLPQALFRLNLRDLIGVNHAMERRINAHGIMSVEQLCQLTALQMQKAWGSVLGERMWHWLRGADFNDPESERKSIGHQHVLGPEYRTRQQSFLVAQKLLQHTAARLRRLNLWAGGIGSFVEFMGSRYGNADEPTVEPWKAQPYIYECRDTFTLQHHLAKLWESCPEGKPLRGCGSALRDPEGTPLSQACAPHPDPNSGQEVSCEFVVSAELDEFLAQRVLCPLDHPFYNILGSPICKTGR